MTHPKMLYTYVGIDSHKDTHTAVLLDCFFEKLGEIRFSAMPSEFPLFLEKAKSLKADGTELMFGLEDTGSFGRNLAVFLTDKSLIVKHVNSVLVARERRNQNITQKTDSVDAMCAARVLLARFSELPDADPQDKYWILRSLVVRRNQIVRSNTSMKIHLHTLLTQHYPNYRTFFRYIEGKTSLAFFKKYPSPKTLEGVTVKELADFLKDVSRDIFGEEKAGFILGSLEDTEAPYQEIRDISVQSTIRQIEFNLEEMERLELVMGEYLDSFGSTLTSMAGIDTVSACQLMSCIGDVRKFKTAAKLARYAGIAPVTYASGGKDIKFANQRGNRELNSLFYALAVRLTSPVGPNNKILNMFFYEYFHKKQTEGKTKRQALKCVQRRLVNIIWNMLTYSEEYIGPPVFDRPEEKGEPQK
jgi:transposase